jgi:hypothetical protein
MSEISNRTIELFSGAKVFSSVAQVLGYETFGVDRNPDAKPDLVADIADVTAAQLPHDPLVIWASPPDAIFNSADQGAHWDEHGYPTSPAAAEAMEVFGKALRLISDVKAKWWFIENPYGPLRGFTTMTGFNRGYPTRNRITIDHSEYGDVPSFRTDVWTNAFWWQPRFEAISRLHRRPANTKIQAVHASGRRLPAAAIAEMFDQLDHHMRARDTTPMRPEELDG